jgi:predicted nuclease of predicted toxin-antitoxin system
MIKMLLDQGLPRTAASLLRERGWDVQHVSELGMSKAEDSAIIDLARLEQRMVVTLDADFHALLAVSGATGPSVLRVRMEGQKADQIVALVERVLALASDELNQGAMITVVDGKVRIKLLPVSK